MFWIGLTGGLASGKSTVSAYLKSQGIALIDADELAKEVTLSNGPGFQLIVNRFGKELVSTNGELDRKKLASKVFKSKKDLSDLEAIVHPLVQSRVLELKNLFLNSHHFWCFYDVPLLFEKNLESQFDAVLLVSSKIETQRSRAQKRNNWTREEIDLRLGAQIPLSNKVTRTSFVVENNGTLADLYRSVDEVLIKLKDHLCKTGTLKKT